MSGRWPANVILSHGMAEVLDKQSWNRKSAGRYLKPEDPKEYGARGRTAPSTSILERSDQPRDNSYAGEEGGASRFFLNAGYEPWELDWILANGLRPCGQ